MSTRILVTACVMCQGLWLGGCASPVVDRLLASADRGLKMAIENDKTLFAITEQEIDKRLDRLDRAFDDDVDEAARNAMLDPAWVKEARAGYALAMMNHLETRSKLEDMKRIVLENLSTVRQTVAQARAVYQATMSQQQRVELLLNERRRKSSVDQLDE